MYHDTMSNIKPLCFDGRTCNKFSKNAISVADDVAIASMMVYDAYDKDTSFNYEFKKWELLLIRKRDTFTANGVTYRFEK